MKPFTVIGFYNETHQIFNHHVQANNTEHAFFVVAQEHPDAVFTAAIAGYLYEDNGIGFPGESCVDAETVLDQPEIFNTDTMAYTDGTIVISDTVINDWHMSEIGEGWIAPTSHKQPYRLLVEQCVNSKRIFFNIIPQIMDELSHDVVKKGLSGLLEIRNGVPGMSFGEHEDDLSIHVYTDLKEGISIVFDSETDIIKKDYYSYDHGTSLPALLYKSPDPDYLDQVRQLLAEKHLSELDHGDWVVTDTGNWSSDNEIWCCPVYLEHIKDQRKKRITVNVAFEHGKIVPRQA